MLSRISNLIHRNLIKSLLLISLFIFNALASLQNEVGLPRYDIFTPEDYDSHPQTWEIYQDEDGLMYMANYQDIIIFDGERWTHVAHPEKKGPISFYLDDNGRLFAGFHNDFGYFQQDKYGFYQFRSLFSLLPDNKKDINNFHQIIGLNNQIYISTMNEVFRFVENAEGIEDDSLIVIDVDGENPVGRLMICNDELFLFHIKKGLYKIENDSLVQLTEGPPLDRNTIWSIIDRDDDLLLVSNSIGLCKYENGKVDVFPSEASDFAIKNHGNFSIELDDNVFTLGSRLDGLVLINRNGEILRHFKVNSCLESNLINKPAFLDNQNGLWIPCNGGISRIETFSPLEIFPDFDEQKESTLKMIRFKNTLYSAADQGVFKLNKSDKNTLSTWEKCEGLQHLGWDFAYLPDRLIIALANGIYEYYPEKNESQKIEGLNNCLSVIVSADSQYVYAGTWINGLRWYELQGKKLVSKGGIQNSGNYIRNLARDESGNIWYSVEGYHIEKAIPVFNKNGKIIDHNLAVYDSSKGLFLKTSYDVVFWENQITVGSPEGLFRYHAEKDSFILDEEFIEATTPEQRTIQALYTDSKDRLWFTYTDNTLSRLQRINGKLVYDEPVNRSNLDDFYYMYPDKNDVFWISSIDGTILRFDESKMIPDTSTFKPLIRRVILNNDSILNPESLTKNHIPVYLDYELNSFRVEFALPRFDEMESNQYRFRMLGLNDEWSDWSDENYRDFNNLFEGTYKFEVQGRDVYQKISDTASFTFRVYPPWYRSHFAYLIYIALAFTGIYFLIKWRLNKSEIERHRLENLVDERTAEAMEQFKRATEAEHESQRLKDITMLTTALAHEFNNPMAIIKVTTELLQMTLKENEEAMNKLSKINNHILRMSELVDHLVNIQTFKTTDYASGHEMLDLKGMSTFPQKKKKDKDSDQEE